MLVQLVPAAQQLAMVVFAAVCKMDVGALATGEEDVGTTAGMPRTLLTTSSSTQTELVAEHCFNWAHVIF